MGEKAVWKVLAPDGFDEAGLEVIRRAEDIEMVLPGAMTPQALLAEIGKYDGLIIRSASKVTGEVLEAGQKLKIVLRAGIGLDNIDVQAATARGIVVANSPSGNIITTAEHTISLLLALARHIPQANQSVKAGKWDKKKFVGTEIYQKVLGVVGLGKVGSVVARLARGFSMQVIAYDPYISEESLSVRDIEFVSFEELLRRCDFITVHVPLTEATCGIIGAREIAKMKKGVFLINAARGGIIDEKSLIEALRSEHVAGAALDVFETEPPSGSPLLTLENCICTPHLGASTEEAQQRIAVDCAEQLCDFFHAGVVRNAVNMPSIGEELLKRIKPYLQLAGQLGKFQAQIRDKKTKEILIQYFGELAEMDVALITASFLRGFFSVILGDSGINYVNAKVVAAERGVHVIEQKSTESKDFASLVRTSVSEMKKGEIHQVSGTIFGKEEARIVEVDGISLDAYPFGRILMVTNFDRPKVVGNIGMILGEAGINISRMHLGLDSESKKALSLINIDSPVPEKIVAKLRELPDIMSVRQLLL